MNLYPDSDLEGNARESADLKIAEQMPQPRVLPLPHMSDGELYLRVGIPDGLQNDGSWPEHNGIPQHEHSDGQGSIKSDSGEQARFYLRKKSEHGMLGG